MAVTVLHNSNATIHFVDHTGGTRNLTAYWSSGQPGFGHDQVDLVTFADAGHRASPALKNANLSFEWQFEATTGTTGWDVMGSLLEKNGSVRNMLYFPEGGSGTSGKVVLTVPVRVMGIAFNGGIGDILSFTTDVALDGTWALGTV